MQNQKFFQLITNIFKNKKHKIALVAISGGLFFIILLVKIFSGKEKGNEVTLPPAEAIPTIEINKPYQSRLTIQFNVDEEELDLPKSLPIYKLSKDPITQDVMQSLAESFGFTKEPFVTEDAVYGTTYIYFSSKGNLKIIPYSRIVDFKLNKTLDITFDEIPEENSLKLIALDYLLEKKLITKTQELELYKFEALSVGQGGHIVKDTKPNLINLSFVKKIDNYPVLSSIPDIGMLTVGVDADNEVVSVYFDGLPNYQKFQDSPLLSFDEIVGASQTEAKIQSISDGIIDPFSLPSGEITKITINKIEIAYLQENDPDQVYLQPIFLLEGEVKLASEEKSKDATLYLPAVLYQNNNLK